MLLIEPSKFRILDDIVKGSLKGIIMINRLGG